MATVNFNFLNLHQTSEYHFVRKPGNTPDSRRGCGSNNRFHGNRRRLQTQTIRLESFGAFTFPDPDENERYRSFLFLLAMVIDSAAIRIRCSMANELWTSRPGTIDRRQLVSEKCGRHIDDQRAVNSRRRGVCKPGVPICSRRRLPGFGSACFRRRSDFPVVCVNPQFCVAVSYRIR